MIIAVVGQTASGKSDFSLDLADYLLSQTQWRQRFPGGAEIISADAFQLYRGMDIGTAKLPPAERRSYDHHQLDVLWPDESASVAVYQRQARADLAEIAKRQALPIVVGGSGLYLRALLEEFVFPPTDPQVRAAWEEKLAALGPRHLHRLLSQSDAQAAAQINPDNGRRLVRALEVIELTGQPYSATLPAGNYHYPQVIQCELAWEQSLLDERINLRSRLMFENGLLEETRVLLADRAHPLGKTARAATGYAQAIALLEGSLREAEAIEATALATRQLARRQRKWFKRDQRIHRLDPAAAPQANLEFIAGKAEQVLSAQTD